MFFQSFNLRIQRAISSFTVILKYYLTEQYATPELRRYLLTQIVQFVHKFVPYYYPVNVDTTQKISYSYPRGLDSFRYCTACNIARWEHRM